MYTYILWLNSDNHIIYVREVTLKTTGKMTNWLKSYMVYQTGLLIEKQVS